MRFGKLDDLDEMYPSEPEKATKKMVELWLEKDAHASWAKLANALEYARQYALAKRIRETYKCEFITHHTTRPVHSCASVAGSNPT